jgi:drug/metabolite transporter (DMT)-like permease
LPNILYSGLLSTGLGFPIANYALKALGPTRSAAYHNVTPIIAAGFGIILLSEPVTPGLAIGACLTLVGVVIVRQNTFIRPRGAPVTASISEPRTRRLPAAGK